METDTKPQAHDPVERSRSVLRVVFSGSQPLMPPLIVRIAASGTPLGREVDRGVRLRDPRLSRHHATLHVSPAGVLAIVDHASKNGTFVNGVRIERQELALGDVVSVGDTCLVVTEEPPEEAGAAVPGLIGDSAVMRRVRSQIRTLGPTGLTVLLVAETGSGKEVVARALHAASGVTGRFVAVNCAAIPENLFESELFGHTSGAFTGASAHEGFFRAAAGGTLFLDEVGEMPVPMQPKLLRAIEERAVVPLGSTRSIPCAVRIIAATNRHLVNDVERGTFRADLLARLFEASIALPPLRARREDVLTLFVHALGGEARSLSHSLAEALLLHGWPFNVREVVAAARAMSAGTAAAQFDLSDFRARLDALVVSPVSGRGPAVSRIREGSAASAEELRCALAAAGGTVSEAARALGRSRRQVYRWIQKYGIQVDEFRR